MSWKWREESATCLLCLFCLHVLMGCTETELSSTQGDFVSESRTETYRMCTDVCCKRSLCNCGSWTYSHRSWSNIVILHILKRSVRGWTQHTHTHTRKHTLYGWDIDCLGKTQSVKLDLWWKWASVSFSQLTEWHHHRHKALIGQEFRYQSVRISSILTLKQFSDLHLKRYFFDWLWNEL